MLARTGASMACALRRCVTGFDPQNALDGTTMNSIECRASPPHIIHEHAQPPTVGGDEGVAAQFDDLGRRGTWRELDAVGAPGRVDEEGGALSVTTHRHRAWGAVWARRGETQQEQP